MTTLSVGAVWYRARFDDEAIAAISLRCRVGCYPGSAGLSVVHLFALSLPPEAMRATARVV